MPVHVGVSRRQFIGSMVAAGSAGLLLGNRAWASPAEDADFVALLADIHIPSNRTMTNGTTNMTENFERVAEELLALEKAPQHVIVAGDCAYLKGLDDDYKQLAILLEPLSIGNLPVHLTLGNHDNLERMYQHLSNHQPEKPVVEGKHASVVQLPHANWFLLDSLSETENVTGILGEKQIVWLSDTLDQLNDKPAILVAHHHPQWEQNGRVSGLLETNELFPMLAQKPHVQAYIYGHTHNWEQKEYKGIHLINLPPCAYVFDKAKPNGWVSAHVKQDGMTLTLSALDKEHPQHNQRIELAWR